MPTPLDHARAAVLELEAALASEDPDAVDEVAADYVTLRKVDELPAATYTDRLLNAAHGHLMRMERAALDDWKRAAVPAGVTG